MTAASGPRIPAPGRGRLRGVEKEGENLPRKPASLPLGLGSLEHEFGGLHIGVFGHGRGKAREPEQERAREAQSGDWARALGKRTRQRSGRVYPLSLAFFHPNVNSQIEFHFLFTAWVRHPQRAEIDPSFFFFFGCAVRTGVSECGSQGDAPSGGRGGSRSRAGCPESLCRVRLRGLGRRR